MRDDYYINTYNSTPMGGYRSTYGKNTYREYEREKYNPRDYIEQMQDNYQIYNEQKEYATRDTSMQNLNDTLESIVNVVAMLKKQTRSPQELDLIKRYIVTLNEL